MNWTADAPRAEPGPGGRRAAALLLVAVALLGAAHAAVLPPWEGFDETAHYSAIQEIADTGRPARLGVSRLSVDVEAYRARAPMPYSASPPFDSNRGLTYRALFASPAATLVARPLLWEPPPSPRRYRPGETGNWEAKQPPLYYALMAPVYRLSRGLGWTDHLLVLRLASWALALVGLAVGVAAIQRGRNEDEAQAWVVAAWPLVAPTFVPEMTRLGNDSLSLLLASGAWALLLGLGGPAPWLRASLLGLVLGLGLLTKALFLPISAGALAVLAVQALGEGDPVARRRRGLGAAVTVAVAVAVGGWWYGAAFLRGGTPMGFLEVPWYENPVSLMARLLGAKASLATSVRAVASMAASFAWGGTASLARPPQAMLLAAVTLPALLFGAYLRALRLPIPPARAWWPLLLALPSVAALVYHAAVWAALTGRGSVTAGWYLHVLAAPLAYAAAVGARLLWASRPGRAALLLSGLVSTAFSIAVSWLQLALFAGCAAKAGEVKTYAFPDGAACLADPTALLARLSLLGRPRLSLLFAAAGLLALGAAARSLARGTTEGGAPRPGSSR